MRILSGFIAFGILLAQSDPAPDARALLMRSGGAVLMADTVRLEGTETDDVVLPGTRTTATGSFVLERSTGGRMRLEVTVASAKTLIIADGDKVWTYVSASQTYIKLPQSSGPANDPFGRLKFSRDPANKTSFSWSSGSA